jgi:hypothetical protein
MNFYYDILNMSVYSDISATNGDLILQSLTDQYIFVHSPATLQSTTDNITIANNITVYRPNDLGKIISNFCINFTFGGT